MRKPVHLKGSDVLGSSRLAIEATSGVIGVVEAIHRAVLQNILPGTAAHAGLVRSTAGIYAAVRTITSAVGGGLDIALAPYGARLAEAESSPEREAVLAALNGVLGDHLAATGNPLAIPMRLRQRGIPIEVKRTELRAAIPDAGDRVLLFVHGLCMNDLQWGRRGRTPGILLARELGWTPLRLHYNTGLHVSTNGRALAALLEKLAAEWPVPPRELAIVGHSYGGLLARSAYYYGVSEGHRWPALLRYVVFVGVPHHGSAWERVGNFAHQLLGSTVYSSPFGRLAGIRSAGVTDMRFGNVIDEDWKGADRFESAADRRQPTPLPGNVGCFAIAATKAPRSSPFADAIGDGLVNVDSALGRHPDPARALSFAPSHQCILNGMTHCELLWRAAVYRKVREWLVSPAVD